MKQLQARTFQKIFIFSLSGALLIFFPNKGKNFWFFTLILIVIIFGSFVASNRISFLILFFLIIFLTIFYKIFRKNLFFSIIIALPVFFYYYQMISKQILNTKVL